MANGSRPAFTFSHWRKSSQWVGLVRPHAQLIADDRDVIGAFHEFCAECVPKDSKPWKVHGPLAWQSSWSCVPGLA